MSDEIGGHRLAKTLTLSRAFVQDFPVEKNRQIQKPKKSTLQKGIQSSTAVTFSTAPIFIHYYTGLETHACFERSQLRH